MSIMPTKPLEAVPFVTEPWRICLLEAAERIRTRGHAKKELVIATWQNCALGAIFDFTYKKGSIGVEHNNNPASNEAMRVLAVKVGGSVANWNNAPERTAEEVISTMISVALAP
jgi:hypothetical protein